MRAVVIVPVLKKAGRQSADVIVATSTRSDESRLEETIGLALAIDLEVVHGTIVPIAQPKPGTLLGSGKIEEIGHLLIENNAGLVIVDHPLTPVQQRNLEKEWNCKVIDRTGLILEIFGRRASTREGTLQVDLAHLNYQKGRLVRSWTHLERQRGGAGFMGGPGETQIEADRRLLQEKIVKLEKELEQVRRTRQLHRAKRKKVPHPIVALVGYTNAGKSTLFNRITGAGVLAEDMLFATLDPTLRRMKLPHGRMVMLSDTVGFISDLPTQLVAAFRATLEDAIEADVLLHVRDVSHGETDAQAGDVAVVLRELGIDPDDTRRIIEVWNKADLLSTEDRERFATTSQRTGEERRPILISALTGDGIPELLATIEQHLALGRLTYEVDVAAEDGQGLAWLHENTEILDRQTKENGHTVLQVRLVAGKEPRFLNRFPEARVL